MPAYLFDDLNASIARHVNRLPAALSLLRRLEPTSRILRRLARVRPRANDDGRVIRRGAPCASEEGRAARAEHCACCGVKQEQVRRTWTSRPKSPSARSSSLPPLLKGCYRLHNNLSSYCSRIIQAHASSEGLLQLDQLFKVGLSSTAQRRQEQHSCLLGSSRMSPVPDVTG